MKDVTEFKYRVDSKRILNRINQLSQIGVDREGGVTRKTLTKEDEEAQSLVREWMQEADLNTRIDDFGNLIGRLEGTEKNAPAIVIGSHIDTVPNGGNFDGVIGVIGGIEVAQVIREEKIEINKPIEIIAFSDEEGTRFQGGLFGSRGMVGKVSTEELMKADETGVSRMEALESFGLQPENRALSIKTPADIEIFLELHIEQGPFLQHVNKPVGIVTGIAGPAWMTFNVYGDSGHAGTVPMSLRSDPLVAAAKVISEINRVCSQDEKASTVGTVGKIHAKPGGMNVIPSYAEFTVDIRDIDVDRRDNCIRRIKKVMEQVTSDKNLSYKITEHLIQDPVECADHIISTLEDVSKELRLNPPLMVSGAGHDAMAMNEIADIGLVFVRCRDGISHNPDEWADIEDISKGVSLLLGTALRYLNDNN